jgi:hypothetical protein
MAVSRVVRGGAERLPGTISITVIVWLSLPTSRYIAMSCSLSADSNVDPHVISVASGSV